MAFNLKEKVESILKPFAKTVGKDIRNLTEKKQDKLKAGVNITIDQDGTISATDSADLSAYAKTAEVQKKLIAGENVTLDEQGNISVKVPEQDLSGYVKGEELTLDGVDLVDVYTKAKEGTEE